MNVIQEEFLLLTERLKLDTRFMPLNIVGTPECTPSFLDNHFAKAVGGLRGIHVGPYMVNWKYDKIPTRKLSEKALESLVEVYKKLFLPDRQIRFIGVDLDDCLYDVTPIRHLLVEKIHKAVGSRFPRPATKGRETLPLQFNDQKTAWALYNAYKDDLEAEDVRKQKALAILTTPPCSPPSEGGDKGGVMAHHFSERLAREIVERTYRAYKDFSRLDDPNIRTLYKPYKGVKDTLRHLVDRDGFIVGILTNGPSRLQRDKISLLGLKEGKHFNFVMVSEDTGIGKPHKGFFDLAREKASSQHRVGARRAVPLQILDNECLILEDQVKNLSGAAGWLKVQFLKGYHSNIPPQDIQEIPKYGITDFSTLPILFNLEKNTDFQATAASYFILNSLLLRRQERT